MANRLKIYACSGIGDAAPKSSGMYNYWTDNTNALSNTQAVNNLLSKINLFVSEVENLRLNDGEVLDRLDVIDMLVVCLDAAQNYADNLEKAGRVIGTMQAQKRFVCDSLNNDERDKHLEELLSWFEDAMTKDGQYVLASDKFLNWWNENVVKLNKVGLDAAQQAAVQAALDSSAISGIGDLDWRDNKELSNYLSNGGTYFLYTYFTDSQIASLPNENRLIFAKKRKQQLATYSYVKSLFVGTYGTESAMKDIIRAGIIARFEDTPENVCKDVISGRRKIEGIGIATEIIVALIGAIVTLLTSLITALCNAVAKSKAQQYAAIDKAAIEASCPNENDFDGLYDKIKKPTVTIGGMGTVILIAVAVGFLLFGKRN